MGKISILSYIFTITATLIVPLGLAIWLGVKKQGTRPVLLGAATFLIFQVFIRLPLIQFVLLQTPWFNVMTVTQPVLTAFFYGFTAALVEEPGRYIVMRFFLKRNRVDDGISFGVGHGGIEAVLLVGINTLFAMFFYFDALSPDMLLASGVERLSAMTMHITWSVMVLNSIRYKKPWLLLVAVVLHTAANFGVLLLVQFGFSIKA